MATTIYNVPLIRGTVIEVDQRCSAQWLVTLRHAMSFANYGIQDGIEPLRRMCRWIVDEQSDEATVSA